MSKAKVLLVEDEMIARMMATSMLQECNCEVDAEETGEAAINAALKNEYSLIFMDLGLGDMDGYTATKKIRAKDNKEAINNSV